MEFILFFILGAWLICIFLPFPIWAFVAIRRSQRKAEEFQDQLIEVESELLKLKSRFPPEAMPTVTPPKGEEPKAAPETTHPVPGPPPLRPSPPPLKVHQVESKIQPEEAAPPVMESSSPPAASAINWERFTGVNLFSWIGGFILFLAAAFFVKYSIDKNLISPEIRVAAAFLLGAGLLITGLRLSKKNFRVTSQTLCATAIVILYADIFAAYSFYGFIGQALAFLLMILATTVAFLLAASLNAKVVAILGMLGGFLTPPLLSTGQDNPAALFGYIAFLDAGLIAVALTKRWNFLTLLGAVGTVITQIGWIAKFFVVAKVSIAMGIFFSFQLLFLAPFVIETRRKNGSTSVSAAVILMPFVTLGVLFYFLSFPELGEQPGKLFTFGLVSDLCLMSIALQTPALHRIHRFGGVVLFCALAKWTFSYLTPDVLNWALALYLGFAVLHTAFPLVLQRRHPDSPTTGWDHFFASLALLLAMIPVFRLTEISSVFWFVVLLINAVAIVFSFMTASLASVVAVLLISIFTILVWLVKMPAELTDLPEFLIVTAGFAMVFFAVGIYALRKIAKKKLPAKRETVVQIPALAAILPFILLILTVLKLPLQNPSPVFALALLLVFLILLLSRMVRMELLTIVGLLCVVSLEYFWHNMHFEPRVGTIPLLWYVFFYTLFTVFPFFFKTEFRELASPWAGAALSGPLHFYLIYRLVSSSYPNAYMGLLPAVFALPSLLSLFLRMRALHKEHPAQNTQIAWFAGVTLFFITLIFPVQFEHEWILIGWALEGTALIWLFHRIPHPGLRWIGVSLLSVAFIALINPDFILLRPRSPHRIFNWYLYTYGIVIVSILTGARLLNTPEKKIGVRRAQSLLYIFGVVLAFLLLNIEIADYYSAGPLLSFQLSGNFAHDMTYSIAWACFAFVLLIAGIRQKISAARYGSILLIGITLMKLFFHDLVNLQQLYRVGALVGVAIVMILASYLYQRFVSFDPKQEQG